MREAEREEVPSPEGGLGWWRGGRGLGWGWPLPPVPEQEEASPMVAEGVNNKGACASAIGLRRAATAGGPPRLRVLRGYPLERLGASKAP